MKTNLEKNKLDEESSENKFLIIESGILKSVSSKTFTSQYGLFTFGAFFDPISGATTDCLIDLEKDYKLSTIKDLIGETLKVEPKSDCPRLKAPYYQTAEIQEVIAESLKKAFNNDNHEFKCLENQQQNNLENFVLSLTDRCNKLGIPVALAVLFPHQGTNN